jgi:hypothetical protein
LLARNVRGEGGAAFVLLVFDDGTEVEGPVVAVPARDTATVSLPVAFPPGDHVISLVLYDAWRENVRVDALHGLLIRSGYPQVDVTEASLLPSPGGADSLIVQVALASRTRRDDTVVPLVVLEPQGSGQPIELSGPDVRVPAGDTVRLRLAFAAGALAAVPYLGSVVTISPSGERVGSGIHGIPFPPGGSRR